MAKKPKTGSTCCIAWVLLICIILERCEFYALGKHTACHDALDMSFDECFYIVGLHCCKILSHPQTCATSPSSGCHSLQDEVEGMHRCYIH